MLQQNITCILPVLPLPPLSLIRAAYTPLIYAIKNHSLDATKHIIASHADVNFINYKKKTALIYAIRHQEVPIIQTLLEAKANPTLGITLISAIRVESIEIVQILLQAGATFDPLSGAKCLLEQRDAFEQTPLIWAVAQRNIDLVCLLLQNNANVNAMDLKGNTPLIYSASNSRYHLKPAERQASSPIASLLLEARADIHPCNTSGNSALSYARKYKNIILCQQFLHVGARLPELRFDESRDRVRVIEPVHDMHPAHFIAFAKDLLDKARIPYKENNIKNHPLVMDLKEAALMATRKRLTNKIAQAPQKLEAYYLLKIIKEKYESQEKLLTEEQLDDVIDQQTRLANHTLAREDYDYSDYEPLSLEAAIMAHQAHQENMRLTPSPAKQPHARSYAVIHYRIFGCETTEHHYMRLRNAIKTWILQ